MNNPDERGTPHLWAHVQEGVLADAGAILEEPALIDAARRSAGALLEPAVRAGFDRVSTTPYDVASAAFGLDRLAAVTGEPGGPVWRPTRARGSTAGTLPGRRSTIVGADGLPTASTRDG